MSWLAFIIQIVVGLMCLAHKTGFYRFDRPVTPGMILLIFFLVVTLQGRVESLVERVDKNLKDK